MEIYLYRMTHIDNVPHILRNGIVHRASPNANPNYISIGDTSLINYRASKKIQVNGITITLGDFIPFYFGVRMPMLYVIQHGYNCVEKKINPQDVVFLTVKCSDIVNSGKEFYFSDGHATDLFTSFYGEADYSNINTLLDWNSIKAKHWSGDGIDTEVKRKKQAEFLVKGDIPVSLVYSYVCYDDVAQYRLLSYSVDKNLIKIFPNAYF